MIDIETDRPALTEAVEDEITAAEVDQLLEIATDADLTGTATGVEVARAVKRRKEEDLLAAPDLAA